jgi:hypothetical protein
MFSLYSTEEAFMKSALIGAALIAAALLAGPASAQEVIEDPGWCAQFYPNANCQNYGPGNPYRGYDTYQSRRSYQYRGDWYGSQARMMRSHSMRHHRHHAHRH